MTGVQTCALPILLVLGVSPEIARRDAEGMEHHVSEETLDAFRLFTQKHGAK